MGLRVETTPVEITASPERVREIMLEFARLPEWHTAQFKSIEIPSGKDSRDLVPGDKLRVSLSAGMSFSPTILENTPTRFVWRGSIPILFTGDHVFEFRPSETTPGSTKFVHYEDFSGLLSFTMSSSAKPGSGSMEGFQKFNEDLKKRCESGA